MIYAQINEENIAFATATVSDDTIVPDTWIPINNNEFVLGKKYNNGVWEDVPQPEPEPVEPQPTNADLMTEIKKSQQNIIDEYTLQLIQEGVL